jgi:hypothetical protein
MKFILLTIALLVTGMCFGQEVPTEQKFSKTPSGFPNNHRILKKPLVFRNNRMFPKIPLDLPHNDVALRKSIIANDPGVLPLSGLAPQAKYLGTVPGGSSAFALPQDNMPCIVPYENATVPMPNVIGMPTLPYRYKGPGAIPNPSVPILLIKPTIKRTIEPQKK